MLITREMDYALRILRALEQEEQLSAAAIAQRENMPKAVTLKVLKQLRAAGLVSSRRGSSGGYVLQRPCEGSYLYDIFSAFGEPIFINRCQQPGYQCENLPVEDCNLNQELCRIQQMLDRELQRTSLSVLFQEKQETGV